MFILLYLLSKRSDVYGYLPEVDFLSPKNGNIIFTLNFYVSSWYLLFKHGDTKHDEYHLKFMSKTKFMINWISYVL